MATRKKVSKKKVNGRRVSARGKKSVAPLGPKDEGTIPLKKICAELGIDANCATREKLRRVFRKGEDAENPNFVAVAGHRMKRRWFFSAAEAKKVREILKPKS